MSGGLLDHLDLTRFDTKIDAEEQSLRKDDVRLRWVRSTDLNEAGETVATLRVNSAELGDEGRYTCRIRNELGFQDDSLFVQILG